MSRIWRYVVASSDNKKNCFFADGQDEGGSSQERGQAEGPESSEAAKTVRVAVRQPSKSGLNWNISNVSVDWL